jgi:hypothetical protein
MTHETINWDKEDNYSNSQKGFLIYLNIANHMYLRF